MQADIATALRWYSKAENRAATIRRQSAEITRLRGEITRLRADIWHDFVVLNGYRFWRTIPCESLCKTAFDAETKRMLEGT